MKTQYTSLLVIAFALCFITGCTVEWTKAIRSGKIAQKEFSETIDIEVNKGLIFVPVTIDGKAYRFLFDTGAPFSISEQLQNELGFEIISQSNMVDSDKNQQKINWARVNSIEIGRINFEQQTAFIGDFEANPLLKCLAIDGIIGSNLIRQANWTIDQKNKILSFSNESEEFKTETSVTIPFRTDDQFNMFIDINIGSAKVKNVLVDYGSNGSVSLSKEIFSVLKDREIITKTLTETGSKQSGIIGKPVNIERTITYSDSVRIGEYFPHHIMIRTGTTTSIGNGLASKFKVVIDWSNKNLHFSEPDNSADLVQFSGLKLGFSQAKGTYIQSVIEQSNAYAQGIRSGMKVLKIDLLDFENKHDFCDYVNHQTGKSIYLQLIDTTGNKKDYRIEKTLF